MPDAFLAFTRPIPSQSLGFVDRDAATLDLCVAGRDLTIAQSPTLLSSDRAGGTTGAGSHPPLPQSTPSRPKRRERERWLT